MMTEIEQKLLDAALVVDKSPLEWREWAAQLRSAALDYKREQAQAAKDVSDPDLVAPASVERQRLQQRMSLEHGWHENSENHTLNATLFFGENDPRPLIKWDKHGHGSPTPALLDLLLGERPKP